MFPKRLLILLPLLQGMPQTNADPIMDLDSITVFDRSTSLIGSSVSASEGYIGQADLEYRPILRSGEVLESIPGLVVTQHSGTGKANQYFLRGFNLDHGTDFATFVDGMPVNMPTHGHGQGYTDINFVIPELIETIHFQKGPYYAEVGDFASAGSANIFLKSTLDQGFGIIGVGENGFFRTVLADSSKVKEGTLVTAFEGQYYDGPWTIGENLNKYNAYLKYSKVTDSTVHQLVFMGYHSSWDSADQIPLRAVNSGLISPLDSLDLSNGGESTRLSLSSQFFRFNDSGETQMNFYGIFYDMDLFSNFTYFLDDPVNGDQFEQADSRMVYGGKVKHTFNNAGIFGKESNQAVGVQFRLDDISDVGLHKTAQRQRLSTVREDDVTELSLGLFYENTIHWTDKLHSVAGLRGDYYIFDVNSDLAANSGHEDDALVSPKLSLVYEANKWMDLYASAGLGFHSNDARGATITVDVSDGVTPVPQVDPLVRSTGAELGARFNWNDKWNSSIGIWWLELDSELLFVGDAGNTEASRASERYGLEIANFFRPTDNITIDLDASFTEAEFDDNDPAGNQIPVAISTVVSSGITYRPDAEGIFGSLRCRYFGPRELVENGTIDSDSTTVYNLRAGYKSAKDWQFHVDVLNLFDSDDDDITYYYPSMLVGEAAGGVEDVHFHIMEPRTVRAYLTYKF